MPLEAGQLFGNYRVVRLLGEGGFGEVYLAENPLIERRAAVKVLHMALARDAELVRRFLNEARAASAIPRRCGAAGATGGPRDAGMPAPVVLPSKAASGTAAAVVTEARPSAKLARAGGSNRRRGPAAKETFPQFQRPAAAPSGYNPAPPSRRQDDPAGF
jgi:hypothetical protein